MACNQRCKGRAIKRGAFAALSANTDRLLCLAAILPCALSSENHLPALSIPTSTQHHQHHRQALRVQLTCARASPPSSTAAPTDIRYTHHTLSSPTRHSTPNAATLPLPPQFQQHHAFTHCYHGPSLPGLLLGLCCSAHPVRTELGQTRARFTRTYGSPCVATPSPSHSISMFRRAIHDANDGLLVIQNKDTPKKYGHNLEPYE